MKSIFKVKWKVSPVAIFSGGIVVNNKEELAIASCASEAIAEHVVALHNASLKGKKK